MDQQIADIIETVVYCAGAVGVVYAIASQWYQKKKSDNETYPARMQALEKLLENPAYAAHLETRVELVNGFVKDDVVYSPEYIRRVVRTALGNIGPDDFN
jgi:hypothetical protein